MLQNIIVELSLVSVAHDVSRHINCGRSVKPKRTINMRAMSEGCDQKVGLYSLSYGARADPSCRDILRIRLQLHISQGHQSLHD